MKTVDIHLHLLSSEVKFDRLFDKLALYFFGKKMGLTAKELIENPYDTYVQNLVDGIRSSEHITKTVIFGVDARVDERGDELHRDLTVCASNDDVLKVYQENPDIIIPFFSINPMRPDALDLIDKYHELGFKGAKFLQNYWGVDTREERYRPYFEKLKAKDIPLIVHIGSESSVHSHKECETLDMLDHPLEVGVTTIAAHMALSYEPHRIFKALSKKPKNFNPEYHQLLEMLEKHEHLYADISAILTPQRAKVLPHLSQQTQIHHKLLYGTDFPVPFTTIFNTYDIPWSRRFALNKITNPFDRYAKSMLEYFPKESAVYGNWERVLI